MVCGILSPMSVTMADIARELNVSVVTVSKVLRNKGKISSAMRKRVLRRAKELNYRTNWIARSLVTRRTFTIGLLLPDFTHPFFAEIAKAVADAVRPHGYHVIISYFEEDASLERVEAESFMARRVDGLILASAQSPGRLELFEAMRDHKLPFVLIDRPIPGVRASFVGVDNKAIGCLATAHLVAQGCRRIGHLRGPKIGIAEARMAGYYRALQDGGLSFSARFVVDGSYKESRGFEGMRELLRMNPIPDGVFCYNDPVAIGAIKAILKAGLRVPEDVAVVGAGNVHYSDMLAVPLTTVDQDTMQIGKQAAGLLLKQIESKEWRPTKILIPPKLIIRQSTIRLPSHQIAPKRLSGRRAAAEF